MKKDDSEESSFVMAPLVGLEPRLSKLRAHMPFDKGITSTSLASPLPKKLTLFGSPDIFVVVGHKPLQGITKNQP